MRPARPLARAAAPLLLACAALAPAPARAYGWMIQHGYTSCATCHVDPSGAGPLTAYGRAQGDLLLRSRWGAAPQQEAAPTAGFLWGALAPPDWLHLGGGIRGLGMEMKVGDSPQSSWGSDFILMQADLAAGVEAGHFRAGASLGAVSNPGNAAAVASYLVSREHWLGWAFGDEGALLLRAGRLNVPYGLRMIDHTLFVRKATRTDINDSQQHGVALAYTGDLFRGEVMAILGNYQISPDSFRERGYSGYLEISPANWLAFGVSSLVTHAGQDVLLRVGNTRQAHGLFGRVAPWRALVLSAEADLVLSAPDGQASTHGLATALQADYELLGGLHLMATLETQDLAQSGISTGGWLGVGWFFAPHADLRVDFMQRSDVIGAARIPVSAAMAQVHLFF